MIPKSVLFVLLLFIIVIIITYTIKSGTVDIRSNFFNLSLYRLNDSNHCHNIRSPLSVYMYDLPPRFNVGMLSRRFTNNDTPPVTFWTLPRWPKHSGLMKQHSVEYWMMASLLYEDNATDPIPTREAIRVLDPGLADVFFVPFFSSVSVNVHGRNMTDPETEVDRQLQVDILKLLRESSYWKRSNGRDHVIPMHHPNAFRFLREEVNTSILVVVDFGRYPKTMANLTKDIVAPYVHVVDSFIDDNPPDPYQSRTTLLFFRGRTVRKDDGKIRAKLVKIFQGCEDVHYEQSSASTDAIKASTQGMRSSKFCLDPAGDTPSSCRLFDAIVSHCVPVIVSDKIELPFEDEIDYSDFSIFFSFDEALTPGYMVKKLREFRKEKWVEMWKKLKNVTHHYEFQYPPKKEDGVNMIWRQVKHKLSAAKLSIHRNRRLKIPDWWG